MASPVWHYARMVLYPVRVASFAILQPAGCHASKAARPFTRKRRVASGANQFQQTERFCQIG